MKILTTIFVSACFTGLTQPVWSQTSEHNSHGIPGYLDPQTGSFKPMAKAPPEETESTAAATGGDFKVTFNITVKSALPATAAITCIFTASTTDLASGLTMNDSMSVVATGTGASRKCVLDMFYSWPLASAASDTVSLSYSITASGTGTSGPVTRESFQTLPSKKPATGGITTETITATL
jgi:hypothetical protein